MLAAINAARSRDVISVTMAHLLVCSGGSHFRFSHGFGYLLITQLVETLQGEQVDQSIQINKFRGKIVAWPDLSADDYIHRLEVESINCLCSYEFTMLYKKRYKIIKQVSAFGCQDEDDDDDDVATPTINITQ